MLLPASIGVMCVLNTFIFKYERGFSILLAELWNFISSLQWIFVILYIQKTNVRKNKRQGLTVLLPADIGVMCVLNFSNFIFKLDLKPLNNYKSGFSILLAELWNFCIYMTPLLWTLV